MKVSTRVHYGLRAMTELARSYREDRLLSIAEIARNEALPLAYLEQLVGELRRAGLVEGTRGVRGGYSFARPPEEITVLEVVELLEGELGADAEKSGPIWVETVDAAKAVLRGATIADVAEKEARAAGAAMYYI